MTYSYVIENGVIFKRKKKLFKVFSFLRIRLISNVKSHIMFNCIFERNSVEDNFKYHSVLRIKSKTPRLFPSKRYPSPITGFTIGDNIRHFISV